MHAAARYRSVGIVGAGAAGLFTALALLRRGWRGEQLCIFEPSGKTANDRTYSYWATERLLPEEVPARSFSELELGRVGGERLRVRAHDYRYYTTRSGPFYASAKRVLAKAGVEWQRAAVSQVTEVDGRAVVHVPGAVARDFDYVLDSRPPVQLGRGGATVQTLQHFGGWYVAFERDAVDAELVVLMDFDAFAEGVGFFYVIPDGPRRALVELAVFSEESWPHERYDACLRAYIARRYGGDISYTIEEREYGGIPMTDEALWRRSTPHVWAIGTRGGWVQPSSGYAFTRIRRFADETADLLGRRKPRPWRPSVVQQVFNSTMLRYILADPARAAPMFMRLFASNGADATFRFLDERAGFAETLRIMWNTPRWTFTELALREASLRLLGRK